MPSTVTQYGMTKSQPGTSVSTTTPVGTGSRLNVSRYYDNLKNEWGGKGRLKDLDCDGMIFSTSDEAHQYALDRGYLQEWFRRGYPERAYQAAIKTVEHGEYKGKRKLTKWLISRVNPTSKRAFFYRMNWLGEKVDF